MNLRNKSLEILLRAYLALTTISPSIALAQQNVKPDSLQVEYETRIKGNLTLECLADSIGNQNGILDNEEETNLKAVFQKTNKIYLVVRVTENESNKFRFLPFSKDSEIKTIFISEQELKSYFKEKYKEKIPPPYEFGILVINKEKLEYVGSAWGSNLYNSSWEEKKINLDFENLMTKRKEDYKKN